MVIGEKMLKNNAKTDEGQGCTTSAAGLAKYTLIAFLFNYQYANKNALTNTQECNDRLSASKPK